MAVTVKVTRDFGPLTDAVETTTSDLRELVLILRERIVRRTQGEGVDVRGSAFADYSPEYSKRKKEALGHARVDLTVSGRMLNDMQVTDVTNTTATLGFVSAGGGGGGGTFIQRSRSLGAADKAAYNNPTREFFGEGPGDEEALVDALERILTERLSTL